MEKKIFMVSQLFTCINDNTHTIEAGANLRFIKAINEYEAQGIFLNLTCNNIAKLKETWPRVHECPITCVELSTVTGYDINGMTWNFKDIINNEAINE